MTSVHDRFIPSQILVADVQGDGPWKITLFRHFGFAAKDSVDYSMLEASFVVEAWFSKLLVEVDADRLDEFEEALDATTVAFMLTRRWVQR